MQSGTNEISYRYDASGNRLYLDQTGQESLEYGYLTGNILCYNYKYDTAREEYADYSYDNNGNLLSKTGVPVNITNTYDGFNRLISSAAGETPVSLSYEYNGDGLRTAKTAKGTRTEFIWDGDRLVCEMSGESVTVYKYGNRLFGFEKDGVKKYYNFNGHGDVTGITDSAYTLIKSYEYDAFGVEKNPDPADTNPFRYCAEYYDAETGYIYLRARYYDVRDGRFISEDPAKDGLNWYVYCGNNPVNFVDPSGNDAIIITPKPVVSEHASIIVQDSRTDKWYYFYWSLWSAWFPEVPKEALTSLDTFNKWNTDMGFRQNSTNYVKATYVEGDFSASVDYFIDLVYNTHIIDIPLMSGGKSYINTGYNLAWANCWQKTKKGFSKGNINGVSVKEFLSFTDIAIPTLGSNDLSYIFFNQRFTKAEADNDVRWAAKYGEAPSKYTNYIQYTFYERGKRYAAIK